MNFDQGDGGSGGGAEGAFESLMNNVMYTGNGSGRINLDLAVTVGQTYKLQMLFADDTGGTRQSEVNFEGVPLPDSPFDSRQGIDDAVRKNTGKAITHQFTAGDSVANIEFFDSNYGHIMALTLEAMEPSPGDTDNDLLPDAWEMANFTNLNQGATDDPDGDGLNNLGEFRAASDPNLPDTDGDGFNDALEVAFGKDPSDPQSKIPASVFFNSSTLDFAGKFLYAIDFGGNGGQQIGDATFTPGNQEGRNTATRGLTIGGVGIGFIPNWNALQMDFDQGDGGSGGGAEGALESLINNVMYTGSGAGHIRIDLDVIVGLTYKLQMLFADDTGGSRKSDVLLDGVPLPQSPFDSRTDIADAVRKKTGKVITHEFTVKDTLATVEFINSSYGHIMALTLEITGGLVPGDSDFDLLPDEWEIRYFGNLDLSGSDDPDTDGLTNRDEYGLGTDPTKPDTDGDGLSDRKELLYHTNPLDPNSKLPPGLFTDRLQLDFTGDFVYAIDFGGSGGQQIDDATFTPGNAQGLDLATPGMELGGTSLIFILNWGPLQMDFDDGDGGSGGGREGALESVLNNLVVTGSGSGSIDINLDVTPGENYKLQMLFSDDTAGDRSSDVAVNGVTLPESRFNSRSGIDNSVRHNTGKVITHSYTAPDEVTEIRFSNSNYGHIMGLTLERLMTITTLKISGSNLELSFLGINTTDTFVVEQSPTLAPPNWTEVANVTFAPGASERSHIATFAKPIGPTMFYRISTLAPAAP